MKKAFLFSVFIGIVFFLTSCEMDENLEPRLSPFGWLLISIFPLTFIGAIADSIYKHKKSKPVREVAKKRMDEAGINPHEVYFMGQYVGGHPEIDNEFFCQLYKKDENLVLCKDVDFFPKTISTIPISSITNILVEDKSSIEKKVTLGRILLVGVFALGWTKKEKHELNFIIIEWKDGRFNHSTVFAFSGEAGVHLASKTRNTLIKLAR